MMEKTGQKISGKYTAFAWFVLLYNFAVILWGAYVRATGSGAGCGAHWPLCNGEVVPLAPKLATIIEYTHRIMSGMTLVFVVILFVWTFRSFEKGSLIRKSAFLILFFTITEALLGAGLVLFELVAENASIARAFAVMAHLVNTFMLIGSIGTTAFWASFGIPKQLKFRGSLFWLGFAGVIGVLILGATGAVTALGDTLFPASSLSEGFQQDLSSTAHFLIRIRVLHPLIALTVGLYIGSISWIFRQRIQNNLVYRLSTGLFLLFLIQLGFGVVNVLLLAPIWMQMLHLLVSDLVWIGIVLLTGLQAALVDVANRLGDEEIHNRISQVAD
jgi:heme A synthase